MVLKQKQHFKDFVSTVSKSQLKIDWKIVVLENRMVKVDSTQLLDLGLDWI